jgi:hypothetical protein
VDPLSQSCFTGYGPLAGSLGPLEMAILIVGAMTGAPATLDRFASTPVKHESKLSFERSNSVARAPLASHKRLRSELAIRRALVPTIADE